MVYEAEVGLSQNGRPTLIYTSRRYPDHRYIYTRIIRTGDDENGREKNFRCSGCYKNKHNHPGFQVKQVKVFDNAFVDDPEAKPHCCVLFRGRVVDAQQTYRETLQANKHSNKTGTQLMRDLTDRLLEKHGEQACEVASELSHSESVKRNMKKVAALAVVYECSINFIAPELRASKKLNSGDILRIHRLQPRPLLLLLDNNSIPIIRGCRYLLMDGTFEKRPRDAQNTYHQTYNIVAVYHNLPERLETFTVAVAFMGKRTQDAYVELFEILRDVLQRNYGIQKELRFDQETAAITAASQVFPWRIRTCYFHYQKNLKEYSQRNCGTMFARNLIFQRWLRGIIGASLLPSRLMQTFIEDQLNNVPNLGNAELNAHFLSYVAYYRRQWLNKLNMVNYYDDDGPRTTNGCEGLHSRLNHSILSTTPDFRTCYMEYRNILTDDYIAFSMARYGTRLKKRDKAYVESETRIREAKATLANILLANQNPGMDDLLKYCRHQAYNSTPDFIRTHEDGQFLMPRERELVQQHPVLNNLIREPVHQRVPVQAPQIPQINNLLQQQVRQQFRPRVPQQPQQQAVRLLFPQPQQQLVRFPAPQVQQRPVRLLFPQHVRPVDNRFQQSVPVPQQRHHRSQFERSLRFPVLNNLLQQQQQPIRQNFPRQ